MPIYEYQCTQCQHQFDVLQKMADDALTECPSCHQQSLQKLVSAAGFQLKGSGWYATDFKKSATPATEPAKVESTTESPQTAAPTKAMESTSSASDADS